MRKVKGPNDIIDGCHCNCLEKDTMRKKPMVHKKGNKRDTVALCPVLTQHHTLH